MAHVSYFLKISYLNLYDRYDSMILFLSIELFDKFFLLYIVYLLYLVYCILYKINQDSLLLWTDLRMDWLIDKLIDSFIHWMIHHIIEWFIDLFFYSFIDWLSNN